MVHGLKRLGAGLAIILVLTGLVRGQERFSEPIAGHSLPLDFFPSRGEPRVLVILVRTADRAPSLSPEDLHHLLFSRADDEITSLAEYYDEVSYGALRLTGEVTDWLELSRPMSDYAGKRFGRNELNRTGNLGVMARESVAAAQAAGVDFTGFDNDNDGLVDGLVIIYSGPLTVGKKSPDRVWPRVDYLSMYGMDPVPAGGVLVDRFAICPEYVGSPARHELRVYAHEFGHLLGLPDYYDKDKSSFGAGALDLMGYNLPGRDRPAVAPSVYSRELLGWVAPRVIDASTLVRLNPIATHPEAIRINTLVPGEYFLVSYRVRTGVDEPLFGEGLLVWHVNERAIYENAAECKVPCSPRPRLALVQADGRNDLERRQRLADPLDFFPGPKGSLAEIGADTGREDDPFQGATTLTFSGLPTGIRISGMKIDQSRAEMRITLGDPAVPCKGKPCFRILDAGWEELEGDGDGFAEPGETMKLRLTMINLGPEVKGVLVRASAPGVRWQKRTKWRSSIGPGEKVELGFNLKIKAAPKDRAAWFSPEITVTTMKPWLSQSLAPRLLIGVPPLMIVNDAPHDLIPHLAPALKQLDIPYLAVDVTEDGLPAMEKIKSAPMVIWLCGLRPLDGDEYPGPERLRLLRAVVENRHTLVLSAGILSGPAPGELLELFGISRAVPAAGIRGAVGNSDHLLGKGLSLRPRYVYYPALTPHLNFVPDEDSRIIFSDLRGRPAAVARFYSDDKEERQERLAALFIGFPLESLRPRELAGLLSRVLASSQSVR